MATRAEIVLDSISPSRVRLTTIAVELPRFLLAEVNTHRVFSRSYASSRAIPVAETLRRVQQEPFMPTYWGKNQKGMQASEECNNPVIINGNELTREENWQLGIMNASVIAKAYNDAGYHKQLVNRLLEPFSYVTGIITATEWENFFTLRTHADAQPEFQELAKCIQVVMEGSTPTLLENKKNEPQAWHLPYVGAADNDLIAAYFKSLKRTFENGAYLKVKKKLSAARCARASFASNERGQTFTIEQDLALYDRLFGPPMHAGPFEHQATPMTYHSYDEQYSQLFMQGREPVEGNILWQDGITHCDREGNFWSGNFKGFIQNRQLL